MKRREHLALNQTPITRRPASRKKSHVFATLVSTAFLSCVVNAQTPSALTNQTATPMPGGHDYIQFLNEAVNPANGSLSLRITFPSPAGRGLTIPLVLNYDSAGTWQAGPPPVNSTSLIVSALNIDGTGGWTSSEPELTAVETTLMAYDSMGNPTPPGCSYISSVGFQDINGDHHALPLVIVNNPTVSPCVDAGLSPPTEVLFGSDDSVTAVATSPNEIQVADEHGTIYDFQFNWPDWSGSGNGDGPFGVAVRSIEDSNGNEVTGTSPFLDTLNDPINSYVAYTTTTENITRSFTLKAQNLNTSGNSYYNCGPVATLTPQTFVTYSAITLPDGTAYQFSYDTTYGLINKVTYPNGGYIQYDWDVNPLSDEANFPTEMIVNGGTNDNTYDIQNGICNEAYGWPAIQHRYVSFDGKTIALQQDFYYSVPTFGTPEVPPSGGPITTVVTRDLIRGTSYTTVYSYGSSATYLSYPHYSLPPWLEAEITTKDSTGHALLTKDEWWYDPRHKLGESVTLEDGTTSETDYTYWSNDSGQIVNAQSLPNQGRLVPYETDYYGFGSGGSHGALMKKTVRSYANFGLTPLFGTPYETPPNSPQFFPSAIIADRPAQDLTYDGNGNVAEDTVYCYDQSPVQPLSGVVQHDDSSYGSGFNVRGNLTQTLEWINQAGGGSATPVSPSNCGQSSTGAQLSSTYTYDQTGQVASEADSRGITTTYSHADNPPVSGKVTNAYLTQSTTAGITHKYAWDYAIGKLTASQDQNDINASRPGTTYIYNDSLHRLTEADYPDGGRTNYYYTDATSNPTVETDVLMDTSGTKRISIVTGDGVGHPIQSQLTDPLGADYVNTIYDGDGNVYQKSNPTRCASNPGTIPSSCSEPTWGYATYSYDALGRMTSRLNPDGTGRSWSYSGSIATFTDENSHSWQRTTDALGRLIVVKEPNSWVTQYAYDTLGNLTCAVQIGPSNPITLSSCSGLSASWRPRSFAYDSLSRLISATNPESGTTSYSYDPDGNLSYKTSPAVNATSGTQTIGYSYDCLNRMIAKFIGPPSNTGCSATWSGQTLATFSYDSSSVSGAQNVVGRLTDEKSYAGNTLVSERQPYAYDAMGRLLNENQYNLANLGSGTPYKPAYRYNFEGDLVASTDGATPVHSVNTQYPCTLPATASDATSWSTLAFVNCYDQAGHTTNVTSNWAILPTNIFTTDSTNGFNPAGQLLNWNQGPNLSGTPALSVSQGYQRRLWLNSILANGHVPIT